MSELSEELEWEMMDIFESGMFPFPIYEHKSARRIVRYLLYRGVLDEEIADAIEDSTADLHIWLNHSGRYMVGEWVIAWVNQCREEYIRERGAPLTPRSSPDPESGLCSFSSDSDGFDSDGNDEELFLQALERRRRRDKRKADIDNGNIPQKDTEQTGSQQRLLNESESDEDTPGATPDSIPSPIPPLPSIHENDSQQWDALSLDSQWDGSQEDGHCGYCNLNLDDQIEEDQTTLKLRDSPEPETEASDLETLQDVPENCDTQCLLSHTLQEVPDCNTQCLLSQTSQDSATDLSLSQDDDMFMCADPDSGAVSDLYSCIPSDLGDLDLDLEQSSLRDSRSNMGSPLDLMESGSQGLPACPNCSCTIPHYGRPFSPVPSPSDTCPPSSYCDLHYVDSIRTMEYNFDTLDQDCPGYVFIMTDSVHNCLAWSAEHAYKIASSRKPERCLLEFRSRNIDIELIWQVKVNHHLEAVKEVHSSLQKYILHSNWYKTSLSNIMAAVSTVVKKYQP